MMRAIVDSRVHWNIEFVENDVIVAQLQSPLFRRVGQTKVGETSYSLYRQKRFYGEFVLDCKGVIIASASKTWTMGGHFKVKYNGESYVFRERWPIQGNKINLYKEKKQIGSIFIKNYDLGNGIMIDLPDKVGLEGKVFLTWLWVIVHQRALFYIH